MRIVRLLLAAAAFGVVAAVVKGNDTGLRDALGNMSAPWAALAFLAGATRRDLRTGALAGLVATAAGLLAFYVAEAFVLDLGDHPLVEDLRLTAGHFNVYERFGLLSGPLYGALGALWTSRRSLLAGLALGAAFVGEPLIVAGLEHTGRWGGGGLFDHPLLVAAEIAVGAALVIRALRATGPRARGAYRP